MYGPIRAPVHSAHRAGPGFRPGWLLLALWGGALASHAAVAPVGTRLEIRLQQEVNSYSGVRGETVRAMLVAPVTVDGVMVLPPGTAVWGKISAVRRVGLGLRAETASLTMDFDQLELPDGRWMPFGSRVIEVENAREKVDVMTGRIKGIRSTATPGYRTAGALTWIAAVDPIALLFSSAAFATMLRFSEPEIRLIPGTELFLTLTQPLDTGLADTGTKPAVAQMPAERRALAELIRSLPYRTQTERGEKDSDLTNLVFIGERAAVARAFQAAGWVEADQVTAATRYRTLRSFAESQEYQQAPMSTLLLGGERAVFNLSKNLNTFQRRHHVRIWETSASWDNRRVFTAAATHDLRIVLSPQQKRLIHVIDGNIDNERTKVVNDLVLTGCVEAIESRDRAWVPADLRNGTGQRLYTDRAAVVLRLNDCPQPRRFDQQMSAAAGPHRGSRLERGTRQALLTLRNDVLRGNFLWQGVSWGARGWRMMARRNRPVNLPTERVLVEGADRHSFEEGAPTSFRGGPHAPEMVYSILPPAPVEPAPPISPDQGPRLERRPWTPVNVELGFSFGQSMFCHSSVGPEGVIISRREPSGARQLFALSAGNQISPGFSLGGTVTLNSSRWISNELGFQYLRGSFQVGLAGVDARGAAIANSVEEQRAGLLTRQFSYSTLFNFRPRESRWRPYIALGPALQLVHLTDAPFRRARGVFRFGLNNVGMLQSAYNFGNAPPLEGGGIFQLAVQGGAGIRVRVNHSWMLRLDYRSTISHKPDFLTRSLARAIEMPDGTLELQSVPKLSSRFAQQRISAGFSFTF